MAAAASLVDFKADLSAWGLHDKAIEYLVAIGLKNHMLLANAAVDDAELTTGLIKPFVDGVTAPDEQEHKLDQGSVMVVAFRAAMRHAWQQCREKLAPPAPATPPATAAAAAAAPPGSAAPPTAPPRSRTELKPGEFEERCAKWESKYSQHKRVFPRLVLQGATKELARVMYEKEITRAFEPPHLGAIVFSRTFNANGSLNEKASEPYVVASDDEDGDHRKKALRYKEPRSTWGFLHALDATKWLWTWAGLCEDASLDLLVVHVKSLLEAGTSLFHCKQLWNKLMWTVCASMQKGNTADKTLVDLMANTLVLQSELFAIQNYVAPPDLDRPAKAVLRPKRDWDASTRGGPSAEDFTNLQRKLKWYKDNSKNPQADARAWAQHRAATSSSSTSWTPQNSDLNDHNPDKGKGKGKNGKGGKNGSKSGNRGGRGGRRQQGF